MSQEVKSTNFTFVKYSSHYNDPVKYFIDRYPRLLVIRASFEVLKSGQKITMISLEKTLEKILKRN